MENAGESELTYIEVIEMKLRLGLLGAQDSVRKMKEVAEEYSDRADFVYLPYKNKSETVRLVQENMDNVDVFVFSGKVPYNIATKNLEIPKPCLYVPHTGTCIYKVLWKIKEDGIPITGISFDTIEKREIEETLEELGIETNQIYTNVYEGDIDYDELAEYHYDLWREGKTTAAVTCLFTTFAKLKKFGVPVYRATITKSLIRRTIDNAIYEGTGKRLKANQIAVLIADIDNFSKIIKNYVSEYEIQRLKIKLHEILLNYAQSVQGALFSFGGDEYLIFTTRGALEHITDGYKATPLLKSVKDNLEIELSCGIGFGKTAYEAEVNARIGLQYAKDRGGGCAFLVSDERHIMGPIGAENSLTYSICNNNKDILELSEKIGISSVYISKLRSIMNEIGENTINSKDMAYYLNITERSSRRILGLLCESGYADEVGEEKASNRGRPRKVYRLKL
ncbi:MAG: ArsR family transcriptional regulator [Firmicutes bacterium]|nr:ArsR family transcriptional regulator [Bacillota bacterium]